MRFRSLMMRGVSVAAVVGTLTAPAVAAAADPAGATASNQIEELVVTAQRRAENAQDVPISMTVLSAETVAQHLATSADLGQLVPNVQLDSNLGFGIPRTGIRGIAQGDFNGNSTTSNMVYLDDLPLNAAIAQGVPIWDLARAEVLRGPQGTLFGRNATGGAIRYIAATPGAEPKGYGEVTVGRFGQRELRAAYGGPVTGSLGARVSFITSHSDGDIRNVTLGIKEGVQDYYGVRGVLEWKPVEALTVQLRAQYFNSDRDLEAWKTTPGPTTKDAFGPAPTLVNGFATVGDLQRSYGFQNLGPPSKYRTRESDVNPNEHIEHTPVTLNVDWDLGFATLTSVSGLLDVKQSYLLDVDATPAPILTEYDKHHNRQLSQEVRLTSSGDGPLKWIAGAFWMEEDIKVALNFDATAWRGNVDYGFPNARTVLYTRGAEQETKTYALFLHTTYQVTPDLMVTAAARYTDERKSIAYRFRSQWEFPTTVPRSSFQTPDFVKAVDSGDFGRLLAAPNAPFSGKKSWDELTWKVGLDYQLNDDTLLFAFVSRGFKGGSFKPTSNTVGEVLNPDGTLLAVNPELVTDYEVGVKSDIVPGRLRVNGGAFYYEYKDYQTNQLDPGTASQVLSNLPKSKVYGAELEVDAIPVDKLTISLGAGVLHTKITRSTDPSIIGNKLPFAENFNANALIKYDIELALGTLTPELSFKYRGDYYTTKENDVKLGGYGVVNARLGYESPNGKYYAAIWGKNLGNRVVPIIVDDASEFFGSDSAYVNQRRTFGLTVGAHF